MKYLVFAAMIGILACKQDGADPNAAAERIGEISSQAVPGTGEKQPTKPIPDPCMLLNEDWLKANTGLPISDLLVKSGDVTPSEYSKSCFFKWSEPGFPNAGIFVQIQTNPMSEEILNWPSSMINSKKAVGDQSADSDQSVKYESYRKFGDDGAYNAAAGQYLWRIKDDFLFMLAFNLQVPIERQKQLADIIGAEVMKNFMKTPESAM